jgi:hypothetical protein
LSDGEIVGGAPVGVDFLEEVGGKRCVHDCNLPWRKWAAAWRSEKRRLGES